MPDNKEKIQQLELDAKNLVENLEKLYNEGVKFSNATEEISKTNGNLVDFIKTSKDLANKSNDIITRINEIGSANILDKITEIEDKQYKLNKQMSDANKTQIKETNINRIITVIGIIVIIIIQILILLK